MSDLNQRAPLAKDAVPDLSRLLADGVRPNIFSEGRFSLFRLTSGQTSLHATAVPHVMVSAGAAITIEAGSLRVTSQALCVAPHVLHTVNARGALFYGISLDGYCAPDADRLAPVRAVTGPALHALIDYISHLRHGDAQEMAAQLAFPHMQLSPEIAEVLWSIRAAPMQRLGQHEASRLAGLERTALLKRFRHETGMTFRRYKTWSGLSAAIRHIKEGAGPAEAAMHAGFADLAHFSRQCRALTGYSPRQGIQYLERAAQMARKA